MSVAGILASSLFSGAGAHIAQNAMGLGSALKSGNTSTAQSDFAAIQQKLAALGSSSTGSTSLGSQMTQLGQDLKSGNLSAAQSDYSTFQTSLLHTLTSKHQSSNPVAATGSTTTAGQLSNTQLTAALQAYSALQQNPLNGTLNSSLIANPNSLSIQA
jgi:hypothetical protein